MRRTGRPSALAHPLRPRQVWVTSLAGDGTQPLGERNDQAEPWPAADTLQLPLLRRITAAILPLRYMDNARYLDASNYAQLPRATVQDYSVQLQCRSQVST